MSEVIEPADEGAAERPHRAIKSFVMRSGRMTEGQQRGLDLGLPKFGLQLEDGLRDFDQVFGRSAPRTFEIGFGMGHATLEMAAAAPEQDFIGVEVHKPGVGALLNGMLTQNLSNIRVYSCDALEVLRDCVADASLEQWRRLHSERQVPLEMPAVVVALPELVTRIMVDNKLAKSGNQARQLIEAGGVRLDGVKLDNVRHQITTVGSDGLVLQVGRRSFVRLLAQAS